MSFPRSLTDGTVKVDLTDADKAVLGLLESAAHSDREMREEAESISRARRWRLNAYATGHERWPRLDNSKLADCLPRIYRVLRREAWELRDLARTCGDDEIASLLFAQANERESLRHAISELEPTAAKLGA